MDQHNKHALSREQHDEFLRACSMFPTDDKTRNLALQFLTDYRLMTAHATTQRPTATVAKCMLYIAQKSQTLYNLKGEKINGVGLSLNQIIRSFSNIEQFVSTIKDVMKSVRLQDREVETDINNSIKKISFGMTFHSKFQKTVKKLDFLEKVSQSYGYIKTFTSFMWLLFIDARSRIYGGSQDIVEVTCLLVSVFYFMIRYSIDYIKPQLFNDVEKEQDKKSLIAKITEKLLELFSIEDFETYRNVVSSFDDYFDQLVQNHIIKHTAEKTDFFSPQLINLNYKRLDAIYQKRLLADDLDERFFLKERLTTLTPSKLTPFARQGYNSKALVMRYKDKDKETKGSVATVASQENKQYSSHRALNYDICEKDLQANLAKIPTITQLKFPKNVMFSPSMSRTPLICATPLTNCMEMYNYLHDKPRVAKDMTFKLRKFEQQASKWIERIVLNERKDNFESMQEKKTREIRFNIIYSLYKIAVEEYYSQFSQEKQCEDLHKALVALSVETVCFVCNVVNMTFRDISETLGLECNILMKANEFFMKFDKGMPFQVRSHFQDLETQLISWDLWRTPQTIESLQRYSTTDYEKEPKSTAETKEKLIKKILTQVAIQISNIGNALKLQEKLLEQVFSTVKYILGYQTDLLENRHLDQMILCSMYVICRTSQIDIKFIDIKTKYEECSQYNKAMHAEIICNVWVHDSTKVDIIKFYNTVFVPKLKIYITVLKQQNNTMRGLAPVFQPSLKQFSTKEAAQCYKRNTKMRSQFTPVSLQNANPSYAVPAQPLVSKKTINFQDEQNNVNVNNARLTNRHYQQQYGQEYHSKKPKQFKDLRGCSSTLSSTSTATFKFTSKREKDLNNTPRVNSYTSNFHNICDTEKIKFNK